MPVSRMCVLNTLIGYVSHLLSTAHNWLGWVVFANCLSMLPTAQGNLVPVLDKTLIGCFIKL